MTVKTPTPARTILTGGATVVAVAITAVPASAVDDQAEANSIASIIADAAPTPDTVVAPDTISNVNVSFKGETDVSVPLDADGTVAITSAGSILDIALPTEVNATDGVVAGDGTVVFEDNGNDAHAAVQALDDGSVRLQTILDRPDAPSTYTYALGSDVELTLLEDGSVEVTETIADGVSATIGLIDAPWAIDANGAHVPTHYTVDGNSLTQHVDHSAEYAYPITADPSISFGWAIYVKYSKSETARYARFTPYGVTATAVCPFLVVPWATATCAAIIAPLATSLDQTFESAAQQGRCVEISQPYYPTAVTLIAQMRWKVVAC